jgi:hypothetical protein
MGWSDMAVDGTVLSYFPIAGTSFTTTENDGVFGTSRPTACFQKNAFILVALGRSSTQSAVSSPEGGLVVE